MPVCNPRKLCTAYKRGKSIPELATDFGLPRSTVRLAILSAGGILRTRAEAARLAMKRGRLKVPPKPKRLRPLQFNRTRTRTRKTLCPAA